MVIMTEVFFLPENSHQIGKILLNLEPAPDFIIIRGPFLRGAHNDGIKAITLYEFEEGKEREAFRFVYDKRMVPFFVVPGFRFTCDTYFEAMEGLRMLGLT